MPTRFIAKGYGLEPGRFSDVAPIGVNSTTNKLEFSPNGTTLQLIDSSGGTFTGAILAADGTAAAPTFASANNTDTGLYFINPGASSQVAASQDGTLAWYLSTGAGLVARQLVLDTTQADVVLNREAAGHYFQRNTTNAQRASWANTYTSATNYEAFSIDWQTTANAALVGTRTAATGTSRSLQIVSQSASAADFYSMLVLKTSAPFSRHGTSASGGSFGAGGNTSGTGNLSQWAEYTSTATSGTVVPFAITPTYNQSSGTAANTDFLINRTQTAVGSGAQLLIAAQVGGAARFSVDSTGSVTSVASMNAGSTSYFGWGTNKATIRDSGTDGVITLTNYANTDFSRLQFGGTTSSFPALKRSSTNLEVRLADDSAYTRITCGLAYTAAGTATTAGGAHAINLGTTSGLGIYFGSGVPTISAAQGSLYIRSDGSSTSTRAYINNSAGSGTTWTAITTAA